MIRFEKDRYVIEVVTHRNPVEDWQELLTGIYELIRNMPADEYVPTRFYAVMDFLCEMLPDWEQAIKMVE